MIKIRADIAALGYAIAVVILLLGAYYANLDKQEKQKQNTIIDEYRAEVKGLDKDLYLCQIKLENAGKECDTTEDVLSWEQCQKMIDNILVKQDPVNCEYKIDVRDPKVQSLQKTVRNSNCYAKYPINPEQGLSITKEVRLEKICGDDANGELVIELKKWTELYDRQKIPFEIKDNRVVCNG